MIELLLVNVCIFLLTSTNAIMPILESFNRRFFPRISDRNSSFKSVQGKAINPLDPRGSAKQLNSVLRLVGMNKYFKLRPNGQILTLEVETDYIRLHIVITIHATQTIK